MIEARDVLVLSSFQQLSNLATYRAAMLPGDIGPLEHEHEQALYDFVQRGGGLICSGDVLEAYHECDLLAEVVGPVHGFCTPRTEIIAHVANEAHSITRRADVSFAFTEACYLLARVPTDAQVLWRTT